MSQQINPVNSPFMKRNQYKIFGLLLGIIVIFFVIVSVFGLFLASQHASGIDEDPLTLIFIRIAFIIFSAPIIIVLFFIGHRIDDKKNVASYRYPLWVELIGLIVGMYLGWELAILWIIIFAVSQGIIWENPLLYAPLPFITSLITYLCVKGMQFLYSLDNKKFYGDSFKWPLIIFILTLPLLFYSWHTLLEISQEESYQNQITISNFKQLQQGNKYIFTADMYVPQTSEYNVTGSVGLSPYIGKVRLDGIENIDGLNNFILTQGMNKLIFYPNPQECPLITASPTHSYVTLKIRKVLASRFTLAQPKVIVENITCR